MDEHVFHTVLVETQAHCGSVRQRSNDCQMCDTSEQDGCRTRNPLASLSQGSETKNNRQDKKSPRNSELVHGHQKVGEIRIYD